MPYTVTRMTVDDYPHWRRAFEDNAEAREEAGSRGGHVFWNDDDHEDVVVFLAWNDLDEARAYMASEAVETEVEEGEVRGEPETLYLEELGRLNA